MPSIDKLLDYQPIDLNDSPRRLTIDGLEYRLPNRLSNYDVINAINPDDAIRDNENLSDWSGRLKHSKSRQLYLVWQQRRHEVDTAADDELRDLLSTYPWRGLPKLACDAPKGSSVFFHNMMKSLISRCIMEGVPLMTRLNAHDLNYLIGDTMARWAAHTNHSAMVLEQDKKAGRITRWRHETKLVGDWIEWRFSQCI